MGRKENEKYNLQFQLISILFFHTEEFTFKESQVVIKASHVFTVSLLVRKKHNLLSDQIFLLTCHITFHCLNVFIYLERTRNFCVRKTKQRKNCDPLVCEIKLNKGQLFSKKQAIQTFSVSYTYITSPQGILYSYSTKYDHVTGIQVQHLFLIKC